MNPAGMGVSGAVWVVLSVGGNRGLLVVGATGYSDSVRRLKT
jgi:hypothetical protein